MSTRYWPYKSGDAWAICDVCGFRFYLSQLSRRWDSLMTCGDDYEDRQPQDTIKGVREKIFVDNPRPEVSDKFLTTTEVTSDDL